MGRWKKMLGIFMAGAVLITGGILPQENAATAARGKDYGISNPRIENGVTTWDKITFGSYYQDAEFEPEPIKWRVLSVDGDDAFLLADRNLDIKPYHDTYTCYISWETCMLRKWLNEDFYNEAFDAGEQKAIMETVVTNEDNPIHGTDGGNDTKDKVYLLSVSEACNPVYGFDSTFKMWCNSRHAKNTDYAEMNNAWGAVNPGPGMAGNNSWWLRTPGNDCGSMTYVEHGYGDYNGVGISYGNNAVRPALHINLSSDKVQDAGEVDSEGNVTASDDGIQSPRIKDGVTTWDCVYFGNYRQSCDFNKQDIEWRVLSVDGDDAFLLADRNLDCKLYHEYNEEREAVTWETCTLRKWLNEDFYNKAFDAGEQNAVIETTVINEVIINEDNPEYDTEGGNDTKDRVYLLSISEASNTAYGFNEIFNRYSETRQAEKTDFAEKNSAYNASNNTLIFNIGYNNAWRLRSHGDSYGYSSAYVDDDGRGCLDLSANRGYIAVRPALHINLSFSVWSKAGRVRSDGNDDDNSTVSPPPSPSVKPDGTAKPTRQPDPDVTASPSQTPSVTTQPTPPSPAKSPAPSEAPVFQKIKLSGVKCVKNAKKITGKLSVKNAAVRIKVGKKAYKKATVKGKTFTLKLNYRLKKKTKVTVRVTKNGYDPLVKSFKVK